MAYTRPEGHGRHPAAFPGEGRGSCPAYRGRQTIQTAAFLADQVLPDRVRVPVHQHDPPPLLGVPAPGRLPGVTDDVAGVQRHAGPSPLVDERRRWRGCITQGRIPRTTFMTVLWKGATL